MYKNAENMESILRSICFHIRAAGRKVLKDYDISPAQFDVLQLLYFDGEKKLSEISKNLGVTKSTTTGLIKRLEILYFLDREQSEEDKRVYRIKLTDSGRELITKVIKKRVEVMQSVIDRLGNEKELIEKLSELQKTIKEVVKSGEYR
ncbi:MAG TPA: MarR family transcriptional regulator [Petrotogaceae bacterium]|jgi:DNA-binding MarR family transcriptional regulator|nr:MarR family transcriptional regulator [Petrotogaceae bacterium]HNV05673.1 MarR family transcriptional regulator [Petrotogaceae bacterium]HNY37496.1 MarR family transcriptional regulator [Petrotogaceae bacterium]HOG33691.1 MarR family transcriptional regulator [Petrotogaceae bacterium]HPG48013.1 MarR family transcriptional regulator [Petrotogaceae bacterium]